MKIAIISDPHLGVSFDSETGEDSFDQFGESLDRAISAKADLIVLPGDIFDTRSPKQEILAKAMNLLQKPLLAQKNGIKLLGFAGKEKGVSPIAQHGIPVVAIFGNHDRRSENQTNPVQVLESSGCIIYIDKETVIFENMGEKVAITGIGGISDSDVKRVIGEWAPKKVENAFNLFMFHQSLKEAVFDVHGDFMSVDELPKGFDLYVDGHIHARQWMENKKLLIVGSTALTQQTETEAKQGKGFFIIETSPLKVDYVNLGGQRPFYFKKISIDDANQDNVTAAVKEFLATIPAGVKKPLVKIKLLGNMENGRRANQLDLSLFREDEGKIISIDNELESDDFKKLVTELRDLHQSKKSVDDMGMDLIKELLAQTSYAGLNVDEIIGPLSEGETSAILEKVLERSKKDSDQAKL